MKTSGWRWTLSQKHCKTAKVKGQSAKAVKYVPEYQTRVGNNQTRATDLTHTIIIATSQTDQGAVVARSRPIPEEIKKCRSLTASQQDSNSKVR